MSAVIITGLHSEGMGGGFGEGVEGGVVWEGT